MPVIGTLVLVDTWNRRLERREAILTEAIGCKATSRIECFTYVPTYTGHEPAKEVGQSHCSAFGLHSRAGSRGNSDRCIICALVLPAIIVFPLGWELAIRCSD